MENSSQSTKKKDKKTEKSSKTGRPHVHDAHKRLNFLHQIALQLSGQSSEVNDGYAQLSRSVGKHFRGVLDTERVKIDPEIMRTFCKTCKQVLSAKGKRFELRMIQRKVMQRKCFQCGDLRNFELNTGHLSRNERFQDSTST